MKLSLSIATAVLCIIPFQAGAQCGAPSALRPALLAGKIQRVPLVPDKGQSTPEDTTAATTAPTMAGLWDVVFTSGGQLYDEGFDQYHSDGTEIMVDITPPAGGNVCLGVWTKTGTKTYQLRHPFWIFDLSGNLIGRGLLSEQMTLNDRGDAYTGSFTFAFRDLNGHPISGMPDVSGSLNATRITAN